ncbi:MAG: OsmC family protein [bacterium]|nr:OsmC family protein [bacterium]
MQVELKRVGNMKFEAVGAGGNSAVVDGPKKSGGTEEGLRPMETMLVALASCSAMDIVHILKKQRQELEDLNISVTGERVDAVPSVFSSIELHYAATGKVDLEKLERAAELSIGTYCSVAAMLRDKVEITYRCSVG